MSPRPLGRPRPLYATCDAGGEQSLANELVKLKCEQVSPAHRGVYFWGGEEVLWRVNIYSRLANRVLIPLVEFSAKDRHSLYEACKEVRWDWWVHTSQTISVDASSHKSELQHTHFIAQVVKDAVVDSLRDRFEDRPSVDTQNPDLPINARLSEDVCTISLDASGARLHRRGYRIDGGPAPLKETLASLLNHLIQWRPHEPMIDLTCGSGTILIEAALRAMMVPPNKKRIESEGFAFQKWRSHAHSRFETWLNMTPNPKSFTAHFWGSDLNHQQITRAKANASKAGLDPNLIQWQQGDFNQSAAQASQWLNDLGHSIKSGQRRAVLLMNLPYGERLKNNPSQTVQFYRELGGQFKQFFKDCEAWLLVSDESPWREVGLKPAMKIPLRNGGISVKLVQFKLY